MIPRYFATSSNYSFCCHCFDCETLVVEMTYCAFKQNAVMMRLLHCDVLFAKILLSEVSESLHLLSKLGTKRNLMWCLHIYIYTTTNYKTTTTTTKRDRHELKSVEREQNKAAHDQISNNK